MMYEFHLASNYVMFVMMAVYPASSSRSDVYFCIANCRLDKSNLISHVYYYILQFLYRYLHKQGREDKS